MKSKSKKIERHMANESKINLVHHYWNSINYIFSLIKGSEIKAGLILSFYGLLLNLVFQKINFILGGDKISILLYVITGLWVLITCISIFFSIQCFIPKLEGKYDKNIFFYRDIVSKFGDIHEFSKTFHSVSKDEKELFEELGQQIFILSKIASKKFKSVNNSLKFLAIGLVLLLLLIIVFLFSR
ncbi:DUF5706 domain-containing protein [Weeksellaceae bacterium KMM 9713]|uniref:DUF5706 domain-containing protein n=1 Tax=Profundicola chukchiensis TaxID=2961959 RepID=A0A9X4RUX5_9FLAO|nr:Pycsar system effector family protein [Profundicola chukchiensis]MDG4946126.1 DUF5706 domain-containing protein [Profundicola chukchiensis]MDG4951106.1 DUF5706 domain-containing protein [Profundicola chukchiensis]